MKSLQAFANVLLFPALVAHELTHAAVAFPWAKRLNVTANPLSGETHVDIQWGDGVARWQVALVSLAPFIAGMVAFGVGMILWIVHGPAMPGSVMELSAVAILATWWGVYVKPSPDDVYEAVNGGTQ